MRHRNARPIKSKFSGNGNEISESPQFVGSPSTFSFQGANNFPSSPDFVGSESNFSFQGGSYSNKFPQNVNRMGRMVGPGSDMSFAGGPYSDKFPVKNHSTPEQRGFMNAAGDRPFITGINYGKSRRNSADRISINPVVGAERAVAGDDNCDQPKCGNMGGVYRRCRKQGCTCTDMTVPNGECVSENSRRGQIGIAQQKKMGLRDSSGRKVNLTPRQVNSRKMNASGCGYNNFHHKSNFSGNRMRNNYSIFS